MGAHNGSDTEAPKPAATLGGGFDQADGSPARRVHHVTPEP